MRNLRGDGLYITVENKFGDMPTVTFAPTTDFGTGGGSDYTPPPKPFDYERAADGLSGTIKRGYVYFGRNGQDANAAGTTVNSSGTWGLQVYEQSGIYSTSIVKITNQTNNDNYTYFKLYDIDSNFNVTMDYRDALILLPFYSRS